MSEKPAVSDEMKKAIDKAVWYTMLPPRLREYHSMCTHLADDLKHYVSHHILYEKKFAGNPITQLGMALEEVAKHYEENHQKFTPAPLEENNFKGPVVGPHDELNS